MATLIRKRQLGTHVPQIHAEALMMAHAVSNGSKKPKETETNQITVDTDSFEMRIDTGASHCISYDKQDFVGRLTPTRGSIQGYHEVSRTNSL